MSMHCIRSSASSRLRVFLLISGLSASAARLAASDLSFTGQFSRDDDRAQFTFVLSSSAAVTIRTLSWAGGVNASGATIAGGGFDPSLAVFDSNGLLVASNRDAGCDAAARDANTSVCWDSLLNLSLPPGQYQAVLTQSENVAQGPWLSDGFVYDGMASFTADQSSSQAGGFQDLFRNPRTGSWALDILGVDSGQTGGIKPASALLNAASFQPGAVAPNTILAYFGSGFIPGQLDIRIGDLSATVLYADASQINFALPQLIPAGNSVLSISQGGNQIASIPVQVAASAPGVFTIAPGGAGQAAVLNADYGLNGPSSPARRGSFIMLYGTGFGAGYLDSTGLTFLSTGVSATVGGVAAEVQFAGLAPGMSSGVQQINIRIPDDSPVGPAVPVRLQSGAGLTQIGTTIAIAE